MPKPTSGTSRSRRSPEQPRGAERLASRVVACDGRAEHAQRRVALELVDEAALGLDHVDHDAEELVEEPHDL